jgi:hypothetical protein
MATTSNVTYLKQYKTRKKINRIKEKVISEDVLILMSILTGLTAVSIGIIMLSLHYNLYQDPVFNSTNTDMYMRYYPSFP